MWFSGSVVMQVCFSSGPEYPAPLWLNVHLVEADDATAAISQFEALGMEAEGDSKGSLTWGERPAEWRYVGVIQIMPLQGFEGVAEPGDEVAYTQLEVASEKDLDSLLSGDNVPVVYQQ